MRWTGTVIWSLFVLNTLANQESLNKNWNWFDKRFESQRKCTQKSSKHDLYLKNKIPIFQSIFSRYDPFPLFTRDTRTKIKIKHSLISVPIKPYLHKVISKLILLKDPWLIRPKVKTRISDVLMQVQINHLSTSFLLAVHLYVVYNCIKIFDFQKSACFFKACYNKLRVACLKYVYKYLKICDPMIERDECSMYHTDIFLGTPFPNFG